jgi:prepilin-type N-terminal cleavage/methylation domain-containing protein/prepilin-type processing-associated H-X9-DG protein
MNKKGFTILELLVVMVILGILAAILLPVLSRVRESGRRIQCTNNLRQHGIAWYLYLDDHEERFPPYGDPIDGGVGTLTFGGKGGEIGDPSSAAEYRAINRYVDIYNEDNPAKELFHCPNDIKPNATAANKTTFNQFGCSYSLSSYIYLFGSFTDLSPRPFRTITSPKNKVYMERCNANNTPGHGGSGKDPGNQLTPVMVLFVDGHVGGPYKYSNEFEAYDVNTTKPVIIDPNGTADMYD